MTAKNLYKELKKEAKAMENLENTKLFVSDTVSKYLRKEVEKLARKSMEMTVVDAELGIITEAEARRELEVEMLVCRSL